MHRNTMFRMIPAVMLACVICLSSLPAFAASWYCPSCGRANDSDYAFCPVDGTGNPLTGPADGSAAYTGIQGRTTMKLAARSGPGTEYTEPGTFNVAGEYVTILSITYDSNHVGWMECELTKDGVPVRIYTGLKRFDQSTFDLSAVRVKSDGAFASARMTRKYVPRTGPGSQYRENFGLPKSSYAIPGGKKVKLVDEENGWYEVEWETGYQVKGKKYNYVLRGWVPADAVDY